MKKNMVLIATLCLVLVEVSWAEEKARRDFLVNTYTSSDQSYPFVSRDTSGECVVVWHGYSLDGSRKCTYTERYSAGGALLSSALILDSHVYGEQTFPSLAMGYPGNFTVLWEEGDRSIHAMRYDRDGNPVGTGARLESYPTGDQKAPSVAIDSSGNFVVLW